MLVMSKGALSAQQAESYYEEKYSQDDYYSETQRVTGQWFGSGAVSLGLYGQVAAEDFRAVLRGNHPASGEVLIHAANGQAERRAGWDATFNAPKSVSIQALVGGDERLAAAHRNAVSRALTELEHYALSRRHGGREWVVTDNIVAARFDHIAARPSQHADDGYGPDPHLHTHVVIANLTRRPDGAWRGLDPVEIYRSQSFATAVYRSELAREVQRLGYRIEVTGSDGRWELAGYSRDQVMAFSRRRQDIEEALRQRGLNGAAAAQNIAHQTRLSKDGRDEQSLRAEWLERARQYDINRPRIAALASGRGQIAAVEDRETLQKALRLSVAHHTEREAVIDRRALEATALQHAMGKADLDGMRSEARTWESSGKLIRAGAAVSAPQGAYTTPAMVALERDNLDLMHQGRGQAKPIGVPAEVSTWALERGLSSEQTQAAQLTITARDWITSIEGRAGAAKTTTVGAIRQFAEERGYDVRGFAPTTRAVKALAEAGIDARTVASLLENALARDTAGEVWIIDESSLLSTAQTNRLLHKAKAAGVERLVFVGDQRQHHAIEAGRPIFQMQQPGLAVARLETIRRQRDPALRAAVTHAASGEISEAIDLLERQNKIREIPNSDQRYKAIAREYLVAHEARERILVVSPANEERRQLNAAIRAVLKDAGYVAGHGVEHTVLVNRDLTRAQRGTAQGYDAGDVVRFTRGSKVMGLARGSYATVVSVDREGNRLLVTAADGRRIEYSSARLSGVEVFREERRVFARGDRIQFRAPERSLKVANGEFGAIIELDSKQAVLRMDDGRELSASLDRLPHVDYGYASTSHSSQGATVDRVIVNIDTARSPELVNRKQFYVSISRARSDVRLYTDNRERMGQAVNRSREKSTALEWVHTKPSHGLRIVPERELHSLNRSYTIRR
jgi:conjugative relaxase-like TrwC/TraI family protein